jgi:hypothetical protein
MKYMKKNWLLLGIVLLWVGPVHAEETVMERVAEGLASKPLKADVQLIAVPIRAKSILAGGTIQALERPASEMPPSWSAVIFRVERVVDGNFKVPQNQEISLLDQMKDAAEEKKILKLLTMNFEKPPEEGTDRGWLSMAVIDSYASFGIREGAISTERRRYKLSLARVHKDPDSFVLVKSEML